MKRTLMLPLALAVLYGCAEHTPTAPTPRLANSRPLLGAFPGDNGRLAYVGPTGIETRNPDGSNVQTLSTDGVMPSWSPDGNKVAFISAIDGNNQVYVANADGSGRTQLTFNTGSVGVTNPAWSPNGSKIAFQNDLDGHIYVMDSDGTDVVRLTTVGANGQPSWSPDGTRILFMTPRHGGWPEIYVMNADGTNEVRLTTNVDPDFDPSWSPDGSRILFMHDDASSPGDWPDVFVMNADGTGVTNLTNTPLFAEVSAVWSPDGSRIAFIGSTETASDIYVMNADGTGRTNISNTPAFNEFHLDWQTIPNAPACVFGPRTYTRTQGPPSRVVESFSATPGSYTVDLDDLATSGADAVVTLNGVVIMEGRGTTGEVGPRHKTITVTLLATNVLEVQLRGKKDSKLKVTICLSSGSGCFASLPAPQLSLESTTINGGFVEFQFDVPNYTQFPAALFEPAPNLPACGLNTSASRSWVDIYDGNGTYLHGFCSFAAPSDLNTLWLATPTDQRPTEVYITITDRRCNVVYTSNRVNLGS